jgi:hypothetical protein
VEPRLEPVSKTFDFGTRPSSHPLHSAQVLQPAHIPAAARRRHPAAAAASATLTVPGFHPGPGPIVSSRHHAPFRLAPALWGEAIAAAVRQVLSVRGPMTEDDLLGVLDADGIDLGPDPDGMLADVLDQGAWIPALLGGRIFTHRLSAVEAEHDLIAVGPDLAPLSRRSESRRAARCGRP